MTREDRLSEIKDYINYLDNLYLEIIKNTSSKKIVVGGFSQGGPAILRWLANGKSKTDEVVLWSADIPRDLKFEEYRNATVHSRNWLVYSKTDPLVRQEIYDESIKLFSDSKIPLELIHFEGLHEIAPHILLQLQQRMNQK
jgi:predicted esterase